MFRSLVCSAIALVLMNSPAAHAALTFQATVTVRGEAGKTEGSEQLEVVLGERSMSVRKDKTMAIHDFRTRRRYEIDLASKRYVEYSLYDRVGFAVMEMHNRQFLAGAMAAAKIDSPAFDPVYTEHSLSLPGKAPRTLAQSRDGTVTVLSIDGKELARLADSGSAIGADDAAAFSRFVRYQIGGHPQVLAHIETLRRVPGQLTMVHQEAGRKQSREIRIGSVAPGPVPAYELAPYQPGRASASETDKVIELAQAAPAGAQQRYQAEADEAFADKRPLDGLLGMLEWSLMGGAPLRPYTEEQRAMLSADEGVRTVLGAMNPQEKEAFPAAAAAMLGARKWTTRKVHMLKLFEANHRIKLGEQQAALALFVSVLGTNPSLGGAYKDMGDLLLQTFDTPRAWRSWDAGRRITPQLQLFEHVSEFERTLVRDHPGFF